MANKTINRYLFNLIFLIFSHWWKRIKKKVFYYSCTNWKTYIKKSFNHLNYHKKINLFFCGQSNTKDICFQKPFIVHGKRSLILARRKRNGMGSWTWIRREQSSSLNAIFKISFNGNPSSLTGLPRWYNSLKKRSFRSWWRELTEGNFHLDEKYRKENVENDFARVHFCKFIKYNCRR